MFDTTGLRNLMRDEPPAVVRKGAELDAAVNKGYKLGKQNIPGVNTLANGLPDTMYQPKNKVGSSLTGNTMFSGIPLMEALGSGKIGGNSTVSPQQLNSIFQQGGENNGQSSDAGMGDVTGGIGFGDFMKLSLALSMGVPLPALLPQIISTVTKPVEKPQITDSGDNTGGFEHDKSDFDSQGGWGGFGEDQQEADNPDDNDNNTAGGGGDNDGGGGFGGGGNANGGGSAAGGPDGGR